MTEPSTASAPGTYASLMETLRALDFDHLGVLFNQRRGAFLQDLGQQEPAHSPAAQALVAADVCMEVYREYLAVVARRLERLNQSADRDLAEQKQASAQALEGLRGLLLEVQSARSKGTADLEYWRMVELRQAGYQQVLEDQQQGAGARAAVHAVNAALVAQSAVAAYASLARLLELQPPAGLGEALLLAGEGLAGLLPHAGASAPALQRFLTDLKNQAQLASAAAEPPAGLEHFAAAARQWCLVHQMLITLFEGSLDLQEAEPAALAGLLGAAEQERLQAMVQGRLEAQLNRFLAAQGQAGGRA